MAEYLELGEALGRAMARRGWGLVFGGGGHGLMGAAARGVQAGGGEIIGVAPRFFQRPGVLFDGCTEFIFTETMAQRKTRMEELADAFLALPGAWERWRSSLRSLPSGSWDGTKSP